MENARALDGDTTAKVFDGIDRELSVIKWMMALLLAASVAEMFLTLWIWARLP